MVTIFITISVNILICTIFYLFISLKLEKSASDFHVKKLRKEMDDTIREFNQTADRNISILENRIKLMQKVLKKSGKIDNIDVEISSKDEKKKYLKKSKLHDSIRENFVGTDDLTKKVQDGRNFDFTLDEEIKLPFKSLMKTEKELEAMFKSSDNTQNLITELFQDGYDIGIISKCSGLPQGEVKLILNLNGLL